MANLSVGPPYDLGIYRPDSYHLLHIRMDGDSPYLVRLWDTWREHLLAAVDELPDLDPGDVTQFPPDR